MNLKVFYFTDLQEREKQQLQNLLQVNYDLDFILCQVVK